MWQTGIDWDVAVCVCAFAGVHVSVLLKGAIGLLSWYLRDTKGTRGYSRVLEGTRGTQGVRMLLSSGPQGVLTGSRGVLWGYLGGFPKNAYVRVWLCIFWGA
jgi:hypothetical protein